MYSGTHLREVLHEQERSVAWLARKMGVSESLVHRVISGERTITPAFVERACRVLRLPAQALFFSTDAMRMRKGNAAASPTAESRLAGAAVGAGTGAHPTLRNATDVPMTNLS